MERSKLLLLPLNFSITPSKALFYFCISFTLGVFLESIVYRWGLEELFSGWLLNRVQVMVLGFLVFGILIIFIAFLLAFVYLAFGYGILHYYFHQALKRGLLVRFLADTW